MAQQIKIAELDEKLFIEDDNLIVVEDDIDTKKTTIKELKRSLISDTEDPDPHKFYSSGKIADLINGVRVNQSLAPTRAEFNDLKQEVSNIVGSTGEGKDSEVVAARGSYPTLPERLAGDQKELEKKYIQFPITEHDGMLIDLFNIDNGVAELSIPTYSEETTVYIEGKNKYNLSIESSLGYGSNAVVNIEDNGFTLTYTSSMKNFILPIGQILPAGSYTLYGVATFSNNFHKEASTLRLIYTDGGVDIMTYEYAAVTQFTATKSVRAIQILPNIIESGMWLKMSNVMISDDNTLDRFYPYCDSSFVVPANKTITKSVLVQNCTVRRSASILKATVIDTSYTGDRIKEEIENIKSVTTDPLDYCGLLDNRGTYIYAYNHMSVDSAGICTIDNDYNKERNSLPSVRINILDYSTNDQPRFTLTPPQILNLANSKFLSIQLYIDKTISERFADNDGLKVMLSSDASISNPSVNYFYYNISRKSYVQGWNTIKIKLSDFGIHGNPNWGNITQINFRVYSSESISNVQFWINSVIIDQRMKPTVLFAFDSFCEDAFDYEYPYLYTRGIPVTVFANNKRTLTADYISKVSQLYYMYGWDIGNDGCNPNKEIMVNDDNPREQYMAVKTTRQWIYDNFTPEVLAYSAPFGNLRPISEAILKKLGFAIAKEDADGYCSFFSDKDFAIPMHILSNEPGCGADTIVEMIDEIVETGQVLCIYTNDVTRYGDEISATKVSFETVIAHILEYVKRGELTCMTFSEFYNKCTSK